MGMTIKESLSRLKELKEDYQSFCDEVWQDPDIYNLNAEALGVAVDTMEKYQKIKEIIQHWIDEDLASESPSFADSGTIEDIIEVLKDGKVD